MMAHSRGEGGVYQCQGECSKEKRYSFTSFPVYVRRGYLRQPLDEGHPPKAVEIEIARPGRFVNSGDAMFFHWS